MMQEHVIVKGLSAYPPTCDKHCRWTRGVGQLNAR
jgi:hypothetical protein